jgi:hypothetical protein
MIRRLRELRGLSGLDRGGLLLAVGVYVMAVVCGWSLVGAMIVLWWRP